MASSSSSSSSAATANKSSYYESSEDDELWMVQEEPLVNVLSFGWTEGTYEKNLKHAMIM